MNYKFFSWLWLFSLIGLLPVQAIALDYYWVGNGGSWSDLNHWATTSGGNINHLQIPTPFDDVFFDENSFTENDQTVAIYVGTAVCRDMDWTGATNNPKISGNVGIRIYGSFTLITAMQWNLQGTVTFESTTPGKTITTKGKTMAGLSFSGQGGGWTLMDPLNINGHISLSAGAFSTNDQDIFCRSIWSSSTAVRTLTLGSSTITCNSNSTVPMNLHSTNLTLNAGTSTIKISSTTFGNQSTYVYLTGTAPLIFNNIELTNLDASCFVPSPPYWDIRTETIINTLTINGKQFHLKNNGATPKININSLIISDDCIKSIDYNYQLKIKQIVCNEEVRLTLNIDPLDEIDTIRFNGRLLTLNGTAKPIHKAFLFGDTELNGNNTFDSLAFGPGFLYTLTPNTTQTILDDFSILGNCTGHINIRTSSKGNHATLSKANGTVSGNYLVLKDIHTGGGATFNADNSTDLGNNTGWNINPSPPRDLFWVGGAGNWNESSHWSLISGGPGGACIPTPVDNVIFDANSFTAVSQSVIVNIGNALCNSMTWTTPSLNPSINGNSLNKLRIYGSMTLAWPMNWSFSGEVFFESESAGNTITTARKTFIHDVWFDGPGGGWTLNDTLITASNFILNAGSVHTNSQRVYCKTLFSDNTNPRHLTLGKSVVTCSSPQKDYNLRIRTDNLTLIPDSSTLILTGYNTKSFPSTIYGSQPLNLYNVENGNLYNCSDTGFTNWDIRTKLSIHKLTLRDKQFRLMKNSIGNNVKVSIDSLMVTGDCTKELDTIYNLKIHDIVGSGTTSLILNADAADSITNILFGGLRFTLNGEEAGLHRVILNSDGFLNGNNSFDSLILGPDHMFTLGSGNTQTIVGNLTANGTCTGYIMVRASQFGNSAGLHKSGGTVSADYLILQDMYATGGASWNADHSFDLGNNSGWTINSGTSKDLFWVGGTGNWNESWHWALTSGGAGGACVPSPIDNVFFDPASFTSPNQSVMINTGNAFCHNMTWSGNLTNHQFKGVETGNLHIYGSLELAPNMLWNFPGKVYFAANMPGNTIISSGKIFSNDVYFQGSYTGGWVLWDGFTTAGTLFLNYGSLNTNGMPVNCKIFSSVNGMARTLTLGSTVFTCNTGSNPASYIRINSTNLALNSGTSTFIFNGASSSTYPIIIKGNNSLEFNRFQLANSSFNSTHFNIQAHTKIKKFTVAAYSFSMSTDISTSNIKVVIDTLVLNSMEYGGNYSLDNYLVKYQLKIQEIFSNPGTSLSIYADIQDTIRNITSTGSNFAVRGAGTRFHKVLLNCDATFSSNNVFDSLKFFPAKKYLLQSNSTQTILQHFSALGNGCFPITIQSTSAGIQSGISRASGNVVCGYLELRDQQATGGATFYAGKFSTSVSNNTGWIFSDGPGYVYGLGADTSFCEGDALLISTEYFYGGKSWLWQDGSTNPYYKATQPGKYWVKVTYENECFYADTILVTMKPRPTGSCSGNSPVCEGDPLMLTSNGGSSWSWVGPAGFTSTLQNPLINHPLPVNSGDYIFRAIHNGCKSIPDTVSVEVIPVAAVSVSVSVSENQVCEGTVVTFTSNPVGGGLNPTFQWYKNTIPVGNGSGYTCTPANGDEVYCILTSGLECQTGSPATSNVINMVVYPVIPVSITIAQSEDTICAGTPVTFTATPVNGGTGQELIWKVNGVITGSNQPDFTYTPSDGDRITCTLNAGGACLSGNPAVSNELYMLVREYPNVVLNICPLITTRDSRPFALEGATPPGGIWSGEGVSNGIFYPSLLPENQTSALVTYSFTNYYRCTTSAGQQIQVSPGYGPFSCGQPFTDIRDNSIYHTILIGNVCWMQENLNYGVMLDSYHYQTDNCEAEKYCYSNNPFNCQMQGGLYQWGEAMQYTISEITQGLCPPAWHIATDTEWESLTNGLNGPGIAGDSLKTTGSSGFEALLSGLIYQNHTWAFDNFTIFFWTSTMTGTNRSVAHGLNLHNLSVSQYLALHGNAFSVRCVKD